jgi:hypothetical protein
MIVKAYRSMRVLQCGGASNAASDLLPMIAEAPDIARPQEHER